MNSYWKIDQEQGVQTLPYTNAPAQYLSYEHLPQASRILMCGPNNTALL